MIRMRQILGLSLLVSLGLLVSCTGSLTNRAETQILQAITNRDTALLRLTVVGNEFYGSLIITRPGLAIDSGQVRGEIKQDTLIGDYHYLPFQAAEKKRRPFLLLHKDGSYKKGTGMEKVYMGVPFYVPSTISFANPQFVFHQLR